MLIFGMILVAISMNAVPGIYGLEFGQKFTDVDVHLSKAGFKQILKEDKRVTYNRESETTLEKLEIHIDDKGILGTFSAFYNDSSDDLYYYLLDELCELHGDYAYYDDWFEEYVWEIDGGSLYLCYGEFDYPIVEYAEGVY